MFASFKTPLDNPLKKKRGIVKNVANFAGFISGFWRASWDSTYCSYTYTALHVHAAYGACAMSPLAILYVKFALSKINHCSKI